MSNKEKRMSKTAIAVGFVIIAAVTYPFGGPKGFVTDMSAQFRRVSDALIRSANGGEGNTFQGAFCSIKDKLVEMNRRLDEQYYEQVKIIKRQQAEGKREPAHYTQAQLD